MPHANIWIREENWDYWKELSDKSEHVNFWIMEDKDNARKVRDHIVKEGQDLGILPKPVTKSEIATNNCKIHGTPLDSRGKCLQKGCKYA